MGLAGDALQGAGPEVACPPPQSQPSGGGRQQGRLLSPATGRWGPGSHCGGRCKTTRAGTLLPRPARHTAGRELWETGRLPLCSAGKSCLCGPCPEGCLPRRSRHRASLVLASSSAYKRFSELLPKEERENACSARVPKSQILTLPELRVRCCCSRVGACWGRALFTRCSPRGAAALPSTCGSYSHLGKLFTSRTSAVPTNSFLLLAAPWRIPEIPAARGCCPREAQDRQGHAVSDGPAAERGTGSCVGSAPACGQCLPGSWPSPALRRSSVGRQTPSSTGSAGSSPPRAMGTTACPLKTSSIC